MSGQTMFERYGDEPMRTDDTQGCEHENASLVYVGFGLDEWYCYDCHRRVRVWGGL